MFARLWNDYIAPLMGRPARVQIAALCHRQGEAGPEVLLITSRGSKRWIIPKGWPVDGTDAAGTALQEAWEEAGVKHDGTRPLRIGQYRYDKVVDGGLPVLTNVDVYAIEVQKLLDDFPELHERKRQWLPLDEAARVISEAGLKPLITRLPALLSEARRR